MKRERKIYAVARTTASLHPGPRAVHGDRNDVSRFCCLATYIESLPDTTLNARQVADIYGKSDKLIYGMAKRGAMPSFRMGGIAFDKFRLAAWQRQRAPDCQSCLSRREAA